MSLQLQESVRVNDNSVLKFDDLVLFCLKRQPSWSRWDTRAIEYWLATAISNNLAFWITDVDDASDLKTLVFGRKVNAETIEVLQFCGEFRKHSKVLVLVCRAFHPMVNRMCYSRNTRKNKVKFSNILRHI